MGGMMELITNISRPNPRLYRNQAQIFFLSTGGLDGYYPSDLEEAVRFCSRVEVTAILHLQNGEWIHIAELPKE